jgi:hypothetical protein
MPPVARVFRQYAGARKIPANPMRSAPNSSGGNSRNATLPMMKFADHSSTIAEINA